MGETLWIRKAIESELDKRSKEEERKSLLKLLEERMVKDKEKSLTKGKDGVAHE